MELGGAQQNTLYTVDKLDKEKYNVFLVSGTKGILIEEAGKLKGVKVILLSSLRHEISFLFDLICFFKLQKIMKENNIDIVHTHSSKAGILGRFAAFFSSVPIIIHTVHGFSFNDFQKLPVRILYILFERLAAVFTDKLIVVTKEDIKKGLKAKVGKEGAYTLIHSGINIEEFKGPYDICA